METLDIIIPLFNEEECVNNLINELLNIKSNFKEKLEVNFIIVNDGSTDNSESVLTEYCKENPCIKLINIQTNSGQDVAIAAGFECSTADFAAVIDADLQDPPNLIMDMYNLMTDDIQVVYAQRRKREKESLFKKIFAFMFYRTINLFCNFTIPVDTGNFQLITATVRNSINEMGYKRKFIRGLIPSLGFKSAPCFYDRPPRTTGEPKFTHFKSLMLALTGIVIFANKMIYLFWIAVFILSALCISNFFAGNYLIALFLLLINLPALFIGFLGIQTYIRYKKSQDKPLFIIKSKCNI